MRITIYLDEVDLHNMPESVIKRIIINEVAKEAPRAINKIKNTIAIAERELESAMRMKQIVESVKPRGVKTTDDNEELANFTTVHIK